MLSCRELTRRLASDELAEAGWWANLGAGLHLAMCRHCRRYRAQLRALGPAARRAFGAEAADKKKQAELESKILDRLR